MKNLKINTPLKIFGFFLSVVAFLITLVSVILIGVLVNFKFYFSDKQTVTSEVLGAMAEKEANFITNGFTGNIYFENGKSNLERHLENYYDDKNIFYTVEIINTSEIIASNYKGEECIAKGSAGVYYSFDETATKKYGEVLDKEECLITVYVPQKMSRNDIFSLAYTMVDWGFKYQYAVIFFALGGLVIFLTSLAYLLVSSGHTKDGIKCNFLDKIPFDLYSALMLATAIFSFFLMEDFIPNVYSIYSAVLVFIFVIAWYCLGLLYLLSLSTRIKTQTLFKNTICFIVFKWIFGFLKFIITKIPFMIKTVIFLVVAYFALLTTILAFFSFIFSDAYNFEVTVLFTFVYFPIAGFVIYISALLNHIKLGGEKIAEGNLDYKIDTKYMFGDFKNFSLSLNNINLGLQKSIEEKVKSEKFKTELITNVSHDIKTPLTSIVNYVDLIKKEDCENKKINEYIDVLDRQSLRLKKLVEDLVEASKASTGNLHVELSPCNVGVLLMQTAGEFEDRLDAKNIEIVCEIPETDTIILADGKHLWRVFENLMSNVCKYSMPSTRVYLTLEKVDNKAIITFKNISQTRLKNSSEELLERFVRGDVSRNTEGSGLGIPIAKSLTEIQNGSFDLTVDGDLFKVSLKFNLSE